MKWSFEKLLNYKDEPFKDTGDLDITSSLTERYPEAILDADPFHVSVTVTPDNGDLLVDAHVTGKVVTPSSRSLTPVTLPLDFYFHEVYVLTQAALNRYDNEEVVIIVPDSGTINFDKAVGDNVIVQIPMHVLSPEEKAGTKMPNGNDWEVISEDAFEQRKRKDQKTDPRFAKLKNLHDHLD